MMLSALLVAAVASGPAPVSASPRMTAVSRKIDVSHSELSFRVRHILSRVSGTFGSWNGVLTVDPADLSGGSVEVTIQTASIDTKNENRDKHLRSPDFFAADSFPAITFKSTKVDVSGSDLTVTGDLTMRGVTRSVVLRGSYNGVVGPAEPQKQRIGFSASTTVNRLDYGVRWNRVAEGSNVLGDDVEITINVAAVRQ